MDQANATLAMMTAAIAGVLSVSQMDGDASQDMISIGRHVRHNLFLSPEH
jgi:hypothetical protein